MSNFDDFVERWIERNVRASTHHADGDNAEALRLAERCREDAARDGVNLRHPSLMRSSLSARIAKALTPTARP
jgi:hypothetical protein